MARAPPFRRLCAIARAIRADDPGIGLADLTADVKARATRQGIPWYRPSGRRSLVVSAVDAVLYAEGTIRWTG